MRERLSHLLKRDKTSTHPQQCSVTLSSQGQNQTSASSSSSAGWPSVPNLEPNLEPTLITSPSPHGLLNKGSTSNVTISSGLPLPANYGPAQFMPLGLSSLIIENPTRNTDQTPTTSTTPPDPLSLGPTANGRHPLKASHSTSNNPKPSASTEPTPSISTIQLSQKTLWDQAADSLSPKEKAFIQEHITTAISSHTDFQIILKAVQEKKKKSEEDRWKFTFKGHEVVLCDVADRVCTWLDRFKQIGDIAVNVDPLHAGLPWAGIRLLLQVRSFSFIMVSEC
jgi:hypothetical protein